MLDARSCKIMVCSNGLSLFVPSDTIVICLGEFGEWGEAKCGASGSAGETMVLKNTRALLSPYSDLVARQDPT